jgi:hypothetical protein
MRTNTRTRPRLEVVSAPDDPDPCCGAARRTEGALLHLQIALRTYSCGLPVDWSHVAVRMGQTLVAADADEAHP